jgi:hypothetical protein
MKSTFLLPPLLLASCCMASERQAPSPSVQSVSRPSPTFLSAETLNFLPHVHAVKVSQASKPAKRQIIHILDWHFVPLADFEADQRQAEGKPPLSPKERLLEPSPQGPNTKWESFLAEVEAVQVEQMAFLREMAKSHGLKAVFIEGLAPAELPAFKKLLGHLAQWKKPMAVRIPRLRVVPSGEGRRLRAWPARLAAA